MTTGQILLCGIMVVLFLYSVKMRTVLLDRVIVIALSICGFALVLNPGLAIAIAHAAGIGRGADFVFYAFIVYWLFHRVTLAAEMKRTEEKITALVRMLALARPLREFSREPGPASHGGCKDEKSSDG